jgi:hypothetical protein
MASGIAKGQSGDVSGTKISSSGEAKQIKKSSIASAGLPWIATPSLTEGENQQ